MTVTLHRPLQLQVVLTMLSCSFSSSRCNSAAVSGLGCLSGPAELAEASAMPALGGRGELGRLLLYGTGGGPITEDVRLDWPGLGCKDDEFVGGAEGVRDVIGATVFTSGGVILWCKSLRGEVGTVSTNRKLFQTQQNTDKYTKKLRCNKLRIVDYLTQNRYVADQQPRQASVWANEASA